MWLKRIASRKLAELYSALRRVAKGTDTKEFYQKMVDYVYEKISADEFIEFIKTEKKNEENTYAVGYLDECISVVKEESI